MQRTLQPTVRFPPDAEGAATFNVAIIYEDFHSGKHGIQTCDYLVQNLGQPCEVSHQMWKFEILNLPRLRQAAKKDTENADLLIISSRGASELPESVTVFLDKWSRKPGHPLALVALFTRPGLPCASGTRDYLKSVAKRAEVKFFAGPDAWPGGADEGRVPEEHGLFPPMIDARASDLTSPRWGINE